MALLNLQNIKLQYGSEPLLDGVSLQVERGERLCIVGRNGAGKSSLLRIIAGEIPADAGTILLQSGCIIARLPQEVPADVAGTVFEVIAGGGIDGAPVADYQVEATLSRLKLDGELPFSTLSGGLRRRAWLGRVLVTEPDVLLLDEPTNHLDIDSIDWLEEFLLRAVKTLIFVTHDRQFLRRLATRIVEIDRGQALNWDCDYDTYLVRKEASLEAEAKASALFDKRLAEEEAWIRRGVEARRTKSQSRIRALIEMRAERLERRERMGQVSLNQQDVGRSGRLVVQAEEISFAYEEKPIVTDFSTLIMRGDKVGIIGPNGSGKTTLIKLLLGLLEPDSGSVKLGTNREVAYFDQLRSQLDEEKSVQYNVCGENTTVLFNGEHRHVVGYLQEFLFSRDRIFTPVKLLSGGERNRLLLARLFTKPANLLVMDEPTNDLDAETLELLENLLVEFEGTLLLVSHDRAFLNNVVTSTLVFESEPNDTFVLREYVGGYDDWQRQRPRQSQLSAPKNQLNRRAIPAKTARKLSFKEAEELVGLPDTIEVLETQQVELAARLAHPDTYRKAGTNPQEMTQQLSALDAELAKAFARWEKLLAKQAASE